MGARDNSEGELEVPRPDAPLELAGAQGSAERPRASFLVESRSRGLVYAELRQRVDGGWEPRAFEAPSAELGRFNPERAALPSISLDGAIRYLERHRATRPWLTSAGSASPEACRVLAAADAGGGHGHIRHEGWVTEEASMRRIAYLEDPAQLGQEKRYLGIDGLRHDDQPHRCRSTATRITDPDAFATAFARGVEHPRVRAALDMIFNPDTTPRAATIPIADLLGADGHRYCTGWRLEPVDGSMNVARANRDAWIAARAEGREAEVPRPPARPVPTFEGGEVAFLFKRDDVQERYEIASMFPRPVP